MSEPAKPVRCGNCESKVQILQKTYPVGRRHYTTEHQVVCGYCGIAGAIELDPTLAAQSWNSMWSPRPGDAHPVTRMLQSLAERSPWVRFGARARTKYCAYCGAWRTLGGVHEPHSRFCPWAEARRSLNMPGKAADV